MIERHATKPLEERLFQRKVLLLFGPRQSGKTTLVKALLAARPESSYYLNADELDVRELLRGPSSDSLRALFGGRRLVVIDEAQRVEDIGATLKLAVDALPDVQIVATGSPAFELADRTMEPLTGRKYEIMLLPLSFGELRDAHGLLEERRLLDHRLVYGSYPEIATSPGREEELLRLLASSYLYKDILALSGIKKPVVLEKLLRALALQVGSEVSYNELAGLLRVSATTVEAYIDLLEKAFVVFKLPALARNARNEIKKGKKVYFYDNGIRNAVLGSFASPRLRTDVGALWENYLVAERRKSRAVAAPGPTAGLGDGTYFWRTTQQQEIDYIEERGGVFDVSEFKWSDTKKPRISKTFTGNYPVGRQEVITPKNYHEFL
jgi:uncharacterized protein